MEEFKFPCSQCGACCRRVSDIKHLVPVREDGSCGHLNPDNTCAIYESRPLICRGRDQFFKNGVYQYLSLRDYYMIQNQMCNIMQEEDGMGEEWRIDLHKEYGKKPTFPITMTPHDGTRYEVRKVKDE